jgi:hypothetical protein
MKMSVERWWSDTERGNRSSGREMSYIFTALEINVQKCIYTVYTIHIYCTYSTYTLYWSTSGIVIYYVAGGCHSPNPQEINCFIWEFCV